MGTPNTALRDRHRAVIARGHPPCALCGQPIDYALPWPDPGCYVVDHIIPTAKGGPDTLTNKQPAHRACNRAKADRLDGGPVLRRSGALARPKQRPPANRGPSEGDGSLAAGSVPGENRLSDNESLAAPNLRMLHYL
jgi:hypothetical protein